MSDDTPPTSRDEDGSLLLYDFFKHMTTLALVTLGGVLTISQGERKVAASVLLPVVIAVAISGVVSFHGQDQIIRARLERTPLPKSMKVLRLATTLSFGIGIGMFLTVFLEMLG